MEEESETVIIDNGSGRCKAGFGGESGPRSVLTSVVGRPRDQGMMGVQGSCVGHKPVIWSEIMTTTRPIKRGLVTDWDDMEKIWQYIFHTELGVASEKHPVLLTDPPFNPQANRERMTQIMFESFNTPAVYVGMQGVLSLFSSCRTTGIVLDCGEGLTQAVPVYEGFALPHATATVELAGGDLTDFLMNMLNQRGCSFTSEAARDTVRDIKEKLCYVAADFDKDIRSAAHPSSSQKYKLPDGQVLSLGEERIRCPEALFQPSLIGVSSFGIHELTYKCIMDIHPDIQELLSTNMLLSGGTSLTHGIATRLDSELLALTTGKIKTKINTPSNRENAVWLGAAALGSLSSFRHMFITKREYSECGPSIVHSKCF